MPAGLWLYTLLGGHAQIGWLWTGIVLLFYSLSEPTDIGRVADPVLAVSLVLFSGIGPVMIIARLCRGFRQICLLKWGVPTTGRLVGVESARHSDSMSEIGTLAVKYTFHYTTPDGQVHKTFLITSTPRPEWTDKLTTSYDEKKRKIVFHVPEPAPEEALLYDPKCPARSFIFADFSLGLRVDANDEIPEYELLNALHLLILPGFAVWGLLRLLWNI